MIILTCIVSTPLTISQVVGGQSFTTITIVKQFTSTAVTSVTSSLTSTVITPQNVRYDLTPSGFNNKTGTFILGYSEMGSLFRSNYLCLMYDYFLLNATATYEFHIHFQTKDGGPIHFLILNADQFNRFNHTNCAYGNFGWILHVFEPASDQDWVVPQSGEYVLLFLSRQFYGGQIQLSVQTTDHAIQTSTSAYTTSSTIILLSTQIMTSTLPNLTLPITENSVLIAATITLALVAIASAVILKMKRRAT